MDFVDTLGTKHFVLNGIIVIWAKINTSSNDLACLPNFSAVTRYHFIAILYV